MDVMGPPDVFSSSDVTTIGKIFLAGIAAAILGKPPHIKLRGTPDQVEAIKNALEASKAFDAEVERPDATVQDIMDKLQLKNIAAEEFKARVGVPWPI